MPKQYRILPARLEYVAPRADGQYWETPWERPPITNLPIFPKPPEETPPYYDHALARPNFFKTAGRQWYEPVDLPGWRKHPFVVAQMGKKNMYNTPRALFEAMYDLNSRAGEKGLANRCLETDEVIAGLTLVTLGLEKVQVCTSVLNLLANGTFVPESHDSIRYAGTDDAWLVMLFYHWPGDVPWSTQGGEIGHWTVGVFNKRTVELYHYDALAGGRDERRENLALAWSQFLADEGFKNGWAFVQAPQAEQSGWECGYLTISNVFNLFRNSRQADYVIQSKEQRASLYKVSSWGLIPAALGKPISQTEWTKARDRVVHTIRAWVHTFFGYPIDCPLNPYKVLTDDMETELVKQGKELGWWTTYATADNLRPEFRARQLFNVARDLRRNRVNELIKGLRIRRTIDGWPAWNNESCQWFWSAQTDEEAKRYAPSIVRGPSNYSHRPYANGGDGKPHGPYPYLFTTALGWHKSATSPQTIPHPPTLAAPPAPAPPRPDFSGSLVRFRPDAPLPSIEAIDQRARPQTSTADRGSSRPPLPSESPAPFPAKAATPFSAAGTEEPLTPCPAPLRRSSRIPRPPGALPGSDVGSTSSQQTSRPLTRAQSTAAQALGQMTIGSPKRRTPPSSVRTSQASTDTSRPQNPFSPGGTATTPSQRKARRGPQPPLPSGQALQQVTGTAPQPAKKPWRPVHPPKGPKTVKTQAPAQPPVDTQRPSTRFGGRPAEPPSFPLQLRIPGWFEQYRIDEVTGPDFDNNRTHCPPLTNEYSQEPWNALLWYAGERFKRLPAGKKDRRGR